MTINFFEKLLNHPKPYITGVDLGTMVGKSANSRQAIIKRAIQKGYLISLRRDLFLINNSPKAPVDLFEISTIIYGPSYVSFESALSFHGWIPEAVRTTTCATAKRSNKFETVIGFFSYEHVPINAFSIGVEQHTQDASTLMIASPIKALADMIYCRKKKWRSIDALLDDLRIEISILKDTDKILFLDLIENYPTQRVKNMLISLEKGWPE